MRLVAENISLPVPKVHGSFVHKNHAYIVIERTQGKTIADAWGQLPKNHAKRFLSSYRICWTSYGQSSRPI